MSAGPINVQALDWSDASLLFQQGRAGFFLDASLFGPGFEDPDASAVAGKTGYAVMPPVEAGGASWTGHWMWGIGIPANSQNPGSGLVLHPVDDQQGLSSRSSALITAARRASRPGTKPSTSTR